MRDDHITRELLAAELDRICESAAFRHSLRHQRFLRHLLECKAAGAFASLREMALGIDFFRRAASTYDPKSDPVVRVEARRLRQRLDRYYHAEGASAPFEVLLDKGSYVPVLRIRAEAAVAIGRQPSLVVLPLPSPTLAPADLRFAAALADEITQTLSRLPQVRVFGPESAVAADIAAPTAEARKQLRIEWMVRGRWDDGAPRRLLLEVIGAAGNDALFALRVDTAASDALAIHLSVRTQLLHWFVPLLSAHDGADAGAAHPLHAAAAPRDLAAFDLYQRARYLLKQRSQGLLPRAIDYLQTAVRTDPGFAAAWTELASAYVRRRQLVFDAAERDPGPAKRAAERAIALDPHAGAAYAILAALAYVADFDWFAAAGLFERALAATPRDVSVRCAFATFLMYSARFDESLREYDVVQALDPLDPAIRCHKGALYFYWRRFDRAETLLAQAVEMNPEDVYARLLLADTYAQSGRFEESLDASSRLAAIAPDYANSYVYQARALVLLKRQEEAAAIMLPARARFGRAAITEYEDAMLHVACGDVESTFACLERHALRRANGAHCIVIDPTFAVLHDDSRWRAMLERVGLPCFAGPPDAQAAIALNAT